MTAIIDNMSDCIALEDGFNKLPFRLQGVLNEAMIFAQKTGKNRVALHRSDMNEMLRAILGIDYFSERTSPPAVTTYYGIEVHGFEP